MASPVIARVHYGPSARWLSYYEESFSEQSSGFNESYTYREEPAGMYAPSPESDSTTSEPDQPWATPPRRFLLTTSSSAPASTLSSPQYATQSESLGIPPPTESGWWTFPLPDASTQSSPQYTTQSEALGIPPQSEPGWWTFPLPDTSRSVIPKANALPAAPLPRFVKRQRAPAPTTYPSYHTYTYPAVTPSQSPQFLPAPPVSAFPHAVSRDEHHQLEVLEGTSSTMPMQIHLEQANATDPKTPRRLGYRRQPMACLYCRGRKIACGGPIARPGAEDGRGMCGQCFKRGHPFCIFPTQSNRGLHARVKKEKEEARKMREELQRDMLSGWEMAMDGEEDFDASE
uniref:Zn(2)-C6 fungal-type domain-containing protein n=1 Tax=Mycena chlorophos TaxID=658473 RepID=A0ABQ0LG71_MYCCL|nr:predicted protein [Mycena chlorophos]